MLKSYSEITDESFIASIVFCSECKFIEDNDCLQKAFVIQK